MIHFDTETVGLTGPVILIQYAVDDNPVIIHKVYHESVGKTIKLLRWMCDSDVCGFNLTFDWFHVTKLYNLLSTFEDRERPPDRAGIVRAYKARPVSFCLRPRSALDLFLHSRKGEYQSLMDRKDIRIKKIPWELASPLAQTLKNKLQLPQIYFARGRDGYHWVVEPNPDDPTFADVILRFKGSGGLKAICQDIFGVLPMDEVIKEKTCSYNPYDTMWEHRLQFHIEHWNRKGPLSYAEQDVILLQRLFHHFGEPPGGDYDSELAVQVGASRWRGFEIDLGAIDERIDSQLRRAEGTSVNVNSHREVRAALIKEATPEEALCITDTAAETLEGLMEFRSRLGTLAKEIYNARRAAKELNTLRKLKETGKYCPEFKVIGTRSGRMAGGGGQGSINPQGINRDEQFRRMFVLACEGYKLSGGDFEGFEVTIADAAYQDENLRHDLQTGKSFHGLFGAILYELPYDQIIASKGTDSDYYAPSKNSAFGVFYGAHAHRIATVAGISEEAAQSGYDAFIKKYPGVGTAREIIFDSFCSMRQPGGLGTAIVWRDPPDYIPSLLGFRRYFTLENSIVKCLYQLGNLPPENLDVPGICRRRDRDQTKRGALRSALFACAFQLQAYNMRAAANHVIQATGAQITKELQCLIWTSFQPVGISEWKVQLMNVHDEILCVHIPELTDKINQLVSEFIDVYKSKIPLISMDWRKDVKSWAAIK